MDGLTFERRVKRLESSLEVRRARHPVVERRIRQGRRFRNGFADLRYWQVFEKNLVTGVPEVVYIVRDEQGLPREPYDADVYALVESLGLDWKLSGNRIPTKYDKMRFQAQNEAIDDAREAAADADLKEFIDSDGVDVAQYALHRDLRTQYGAGIKVGMGANTKLQHTKPF